MVALIRESWHSFVGLTRLFFLICTAIRCSHSLSITFALLSSKSLFLLKKTVFWTRFTFDFTMRKWSITVRLWGRGQNCESHGKTVRFGRFMREYLKVSVFFCCSEKRRILTIRAAVYNYVTGIPSSPKRRKVKIFPLINDMYLKNTGFLR